MICSVSLDGIVSTGTRCPPCVRTASAVCRGGLCEVTNPASWLQCCTRMLSHVCGAHHSCFTSRSECSQASASHSVALCTRQIRLGVLHLQTCCSWGKVIITFQFRILATASGMIVNFEDLYMSITETMFGHCRLSKPIMPLFESLSQQAERTKVCPPVSQQSCSCKVHRDTNAVR